MKNIKNESGRSMIEMLGVLAIIGVLSVGGIAGYSKAMQRYRINKAIEQITLIAGNIRSFFAPQGNYIGAYCSGVYCNNNGCQGNTGIDNSGSLTYEYNGCPIIKKAKIFPDEMLTLSDDGTKIMAISNPFGFTATLGIDNKHVSSDNKAFVIVYYIGDNIEACIELMTQDWSNANAKAIRLSDGTTSKSPVSIDLATEKCSALMASTPDDQKAKGYPAIVFFFDIDLNGPYWKSITWQN